MADDLSAQGSGLRARQTKRSPHAQESALSLRTHSDDSSKPQSPLHNLQRDPKLALEKEFEKTKIDHVSREHLV